MAKKKKQTFEVGDYFTIPLTGGKYAIGQIVGVEPDALNSVICALFSQQRNFVPTSNNQDLADSDLVSVLFVTPDLLKSGDWCVVSHGQPFNVAPYIDVDALRDVGFVGVRVIGSWIVTKLLEAYFGLYPWNGFADPDYFDKLLVSEDRKPSIIKLVEK